MKCKLMMPISTLLVATGLCYAQGSGSTEPPRTTIPTYDAQPFQVTRNVQGALIAIDQENRLIAVEDKKGKLFKFRLEDGAKFKADKKTEFGGKKKLMLADFKAGDPVRVVFTPDDGKVIEVRLVYVKVKKA